MNVVKAYLDENSVITNYEAKKLGVERHVLSDLTKKGKLERITLGVYQKAGDIIDDFVLIASNSKRVIYSYHTALYLHDLTDRAPHIYHISVPQGYNASHIKERYANLQVHYVKKDLHELGKSETRTPLGNIVQVYDMERTICDIIVGRDEIDKQIFIDGIKRYFRRNDKNLRRLIKYSRELGVEDEIRKYTEILV